MKPATFQLNPNGPERATVLANAIAFIQCIPSDKAWEITVKRFVKCRSDKQRSALFGVAYKAIMEATGLRGTKDKERLHEDTCGAYFGWADPMPMMRPKPIRTTTKNAAGEDDEISTLQALDMYAFIQQTAAEYGVYVPDPDPMWLRNQEAAPTPAIQGTQP